MTEPARKLWYQCLQALAVRLLRQKPLADYIVDFCCAQCLLAIEIDGESHYTAEGEIYDQHRNAALQRLGIKLLRFTDAEVIHEFQAVCETIRAEAENLRGSLDG